MDASDFDWTYGIASNFKINHETVGHILMIDLDNIERQTARRVAESLPDGIYVLQQSSGRSYNIYSMNWMPMERVIETKAGIPLDDPWHFKIGINRGYWITRIAPKGDKQAPVLVDIIDNREPGNGTYSVPVSLYNMIENIYNGVEELPIFEEASEYLMATDGLTRVKYPSCAERQHTLNGLIREVLRENGQLEDRGAYNE